MAKMSRLPSAIPLNDLPSCSLRCQAIPIVRPPSHHRPCTAQLNNNSARQQQQQQPTLKTRASSGSFPLTPSSFTGGNTTTSKVNPEPSSSSSRDPTAASTSSSSSSSSSTSTTPTSPNNNKRPPSSPSQLVSSIKRDANGAPIPRNKPLKINIDLALYKARQKRTASFWCHDSAQRSTLLREAEDILRRCLARDPEDGRAYVSLGKLLQLTKREGEALKVYEEGCAATGGTNAHIWTAWANLAMNQGNKTLARKLFDAAIVASPSHAAAWHGWGILEKKYGGDIVKARDLWMKGIQATMDNPNPYLYQSLAVLASELGRVDEARQWFRLGTKTMKGQMSHALWQAWARMEEQLQQEDPDIVRMLYRKGLERSPRSRYTFLSWAMFEKKVGKVKEAKKLLKRGLHMNPKDAALAQAWGLIEVEQGNLVEARRLFTKASKADPGHLPVWQAWGCMEFRAGNMDVARDLFQQGIWAAPPRDKNVCMLFQAWAILERAAGDIPLARQLFKCAVKADPTSEPSWLAWAAMEEDMGAVQRAQELRSFSLQERQDVIAPVNFTTLPAGNRAGGLVEKIFVRVASWFGDERGGVYANSEKLPAMLAAVRSVDER